MSSSLPQRKKVLRLRPHPSVADEPASQMAIKVRTHLSLLQGYADIMEGLSPQLKKEIGDDLATKLRDASLELYKHASEHAERRGIILADTKFEFGLIDGELILIDEVLTPDSSRFWDAASYVVGTSPESYDKQFVRDWLESTGWDKNPPAPELPRDVVTKTREDEA